MLSVGPLSGIPAAIWPADDSVTVFLVVSVLTLIGLAAVRPFEDPLSVHFVVFPFTYIVPAICPDIGTDTLDVVVAELTLVTRVIGPGEGPLLAMLVASDVGALVAGAVWPSFHTHAVLFVCYPITLIRSAICIQVLSISMSLAIEPVSLIHIVVALLVFALYFFRSSIGLTIEHRLDLRLRVYEPALSMWLAGEELPLIHRAIFPYLHSQSSLDLPRRTSGDSLSIV